MAAMPKPDRPRADDELGPASHVPLPGQMGLFFELKADEPARPQQDLAEVRKPRRRRPKGRGPASAD
jgi:hypothetical protein